MKLQPLNLPRAQLRTLVLSALKELKSTQFVNLSSRIAQKAVEQQLAQIDERTRTSGGSPTYLSEEDAERVREIIWDLIGDRIVILGSNPEHEGSWPFFKLTEYGLEAVQKSQPSPCDPYGYFLFLEKVVGKEIDEVIKTYIDESLKTFRYGATLASYLTLGCASEKAILLLMDSFLESVENGDREKVRKKIDQFSIKRSFDSLWEIIEPQISDKDRIDDIEKKDLIIYLRPLFEIFRLNRNNAGHPKNLNQSDLDSINECFLLFPHFVKVIYRLIDYFKKRKKS